VIRSDLAGRLRVGTRVLTALVVLTALEVPVAFRVPHPLPWLVVLNLADAGLIVWYFMHAAHLWRTQEE
jgi:cytochrome c oxidase subunit IV